MPEDQKKTYIGVKRIEAYPEDRDGKPGYAVIYPDGYKSWSPRAVFEAAYFPLKDGRFIQDDDIQAFIDASKVDIQVNPGQVMAKVIYPTGFADAEATASSDVERFDERIAAVGCMHEIKERLWTCMLFVMDWATDGLKAKGNSPMSSLIDHAKTEFAILGWDTTDDEMQQEACKCVMELLETLAKQGHSGFSSSYVLSLFNKLANFKPLSPLTGNADEWVKVTEEDGKPFYQNKRYSYVFKLGEDGQAYDDASYPRRDVTFPYQP